MRGIAIIGDAGIENGQLTGAGALADTLANLTDLPVGLRTAASNPASEAMFRDLLNQAEVIPWLTNREDEAPPAHLATIRMGDPIDIANVFEHDLVILDFADPRLRRFLADLPVHTQPNVRIMTSLNLPVEILALESLSDLMRFDILIGHMENFATIPGLDPTDPITDVQSRLMGSNLRLAIAWDKPASRIEIASLDAGLLQGPTTFRTWTEILARTALAILDRATPAEILSTLKA